MPEETPIQTSNISARLFANNSLVILSQSCWGGTATVRPGDEEIFGSTNFDDKFFKRGSIVLVDKAHLEGFKKVISRLNGYVSGVGKMFMIRGISIVKNSEMEAIVEKVKEAQEEMARLRETFVGQYESIVRARCRSFDEAHPQHAGRLDTYFPPVARIERSFNIRFVNFVITDSQGLEEVFEEGREALRRVTGQYVADMAGEFRKTILESVVAFRNSMDSTAAENEGSLNKRKIKAFTDFIDKIQRNDFLGDEQMTNMLKDVRQGVERIESWSAEDIKGDSEHMVELKKAMETIITTASDEGSIAGVVAPFGLDAVDVDMSGVLAWDSSGENMQVESPEIDSSGVILEEPTREQQTDDLSQEVADHPPADEEVSLSDPGENISQESQEGDS